MTSRPLRHGAAGATIERRHNPVSITEEEAPMATTPVAPQDEWTVETVEPLPKRIVSGRESKPNPFLVPVMDSYKEAMEKGDQADGRAIWANVDKGKITVRTTQRRDKQGNVIVTQWQQHPNVARGLYLLRQAADKQDIGVRTVVDYDTQTVPTVTTKVPQLDKSGKPIMVPARDKDGNEVKNADGTTKQVAATTEQTFENVTLHVFKFGTGERKGKVRISFVGQKKKDVKAKKNAAPEENN